MSPPSSAGAQPRRRISLYHDMKFTAVNEEAAAQGETLILPPLILHDMKFDMNEISELVQSGPCGIETETLPKT